MNLFKTLSNYDKHRKIYRNSHQLAHRKLCPSFRRHQCWNRRFIDGFQNILMWIPFYVTIALLAILAWYKSGKGVSIFTILGLLLIWGMGFWNETMQTLALVLSSTIIALIMGLPLGIWSANSKRCDKILHPILDLMQTMPAFVYLIPAVLFFGLGTVPGAFATIIFAMPPVVRLTSLGIKQVPKNVVEASRSFGATPMQLLFKVQLPLALPLS